MKRKGHDFSKAAKVMPNTVIGMTKHSGHIIELIQSSHCKDLLEKELDLTDEKCGWIVVFSNRKDDKIVLCTDLFFQESVCFTTLPKYITDRLLS